MTKRTEIIPYIFYSDVSGALEWLTRVFGFKEDLRIGTPHGGMHGEMSLDGQRIMMGSGGASAKMLNAREAGVATMGIFIYLEDVDGHYERAKAAGAEIAHAPKDENYGRTYTVRDLDGHPWFFCTPPK